LLFPRFHRYFPQHIIRGYADRAGNGSRLQRLDQNIQIALILFFLPGQDMMGSFVQNNRTAPIYQRFQ
jgi:hypothetical protein